MPEKLHNKILLAVAVAGFLVLAGWKLDARWLRGDEGYAGAQHHAIARQMLTHGIFRTRFAQFRVFHDLKEDELFDKDGNFAARELKEKYGDRFWTSRLPFGVLPYAASLAIFGDREFSIRLIPYLSTLALIVLVYLLVKKRYGEDAGVWCAAALALCPGAVLHARLAGHEMPLLCLVVLTLLLYDSFREGRTSFRAVWLSALAAGLMGWFGLFLIIIILAESFRLCSPREVKWRQRGALLLIPLGVFGLYAGYLEMLGQSLRERLEYFWKARSLGGMGMDDDGLGFAANQMTGSFGVLDFLDTVQKFFFNHITPLPIVLCVAWVVVYIFKRKKTAEKIPEARLVWMCAGFGACCYLFALKSAYVHRYYTLWWLPFICLAGGFFLARLLEKKTDEIFPLVDEEGNVIGSAWRGECHGNPKLLHPVVHLIVKNRAGDLLLQLRSKDKKIQPGKWDTSVGGHVAYGEKIHAALTREAREEIGLDIATVTPEFLYRYVMHSDVESELVYTYACVSEGSFARQESEVDELRFWTREEIAGKIGTGLFTPNFEDEFARLQVFERGGNA
jgi:isopentenyldiphosphate isomerase